jgi:hypothetical protein
MALIGKQGEACNAIYGEIAPASAAFGPAHNPRWGLPGGGNTGHEKLTGGKGRKLRLIDQFEVRPHYGVLSGASSD